MKSDDTITKTELRVVVVVISVLFGLLGWFLNNLINDIQTQNKEQWKQAAVTKECFREDLSKLRERVSFLEGSHSKEKK